MSDNNASVPVENAVKFVTLYNRIDEYLRRIVQADTRVAYSEIIRSVAENNRVVRQFRDDLLQFGDLRNAIVHSRGKSDEPVAVPLTEIVQHFASIVDSIISPRYADTLGSPVTILLPDTLLEDILSFMRDGDFSQVVVRQDDRHQLLSTDGITNWLRENVSQDVISLKETSAATILPFEPKGTLAFLPRVATIYDANDRFLLHPDDGRLFAILVTEHGKDREKPLRIITAWDLPSLHK